MSVVLDITVPCSPVGKGRPRVYRGRAVTPKKTVAWEARCALLARTAWSGPPLGRGVPVEVTVVAVYQRPRRLGDGERAPAIRAVPDLDNVVKSVCDAIEGVVYVDDRAVVSLDGSRKLYAASDERPHVRVIVRRLDEGD